MGLSRKIKTFIAIFLISIIFAGCNGETTKETIPPVEKEPEQVEKVIQPTKGGEMHIASRNPKTFNPLINEEQTMNEILKLIYDPLITFDEKQKPIPNLAEKWTFADQGTVLNMTLRSDVKWHDGTPFTAKDVVFSLKTIQKAEPTSVYKKCVQNISYFKAVDEYTVKIVYNQPFSGSLYALYFPIIPAHVYQGQNVLNSEKNMQPIGTGAYQFESFTPMKEINLKANTGWFKGEPYIEKIKVSIMPDEDTELHAFDQNLLDVVSTDVIDWEKYGDNDQTQIHEYITSYYDFIGFNFNKGLFQSKKVRQALAYAMDKQKMLETGYLGHGKVTNVPVNPESWLYDDTTKKYDYNIDTAKQLLTEDGWSDSDEDGILDKTVNGSKTNFSFVLLVNNENEQRKQVAGQMKSMLKEAGIEVSVEAVSKEEYINRLQSKNFQAFLGGWKLSPIPDFTFAFHSSQITEGSNYIAYNSADMDNLLQQAFVAVGEDNMKKAYGDLQKQIAEELPYISLYYRTAAVITQGRIQGEITPIKEFYMNDIQKWFIYEETSEQTEESANKQ